MPELAALRAPRWALVAAGAALLLLMVGHTGNHLWAYDFWAYLSPVREFAAHGLSPRHPLITGDSPDPFLSPFALVLGVGADVGGIDPVTALMVAAIANVALLGAGLVRFARSFTAAPGAGALLVGATLLAWGVGPWRWAGFFNLNGLGYVAPLGSTFASAVALFVLAAAQRWLSGDARAAHLAVVAIGAPTVVLTHPMTALWAGAMAVGLVAAADLRARRTWVLLGVAAAALAATLLWPYYDVTDLFGGASEYDAPNATMFARVVPRTFLALPGVVLATRRLLRRTRDPLALATVSVLAVYLVSWAADRPSFGRVLPGAVLGAHAVMATSLASFWARAGTDGRARRTVAAAVAAIVVVGAIGVAPGAIRGIPRAWLPDRLADDDRLESAVEPYLDVLPGPIGRDDVVLASRAIELPVAAHSGKVLAPPLPAPFLTDDELARRRATVQRLLAGDLRWRERRAALRAEGVEWLVLTPADARRLRLDHDRAGARLVRATDDLVILRLVPARG